MVINAQTLITAGAVIGALITIVGLILKIHKWYLKQNEQEKEIERIKEEDTLLCYGISACLDGLMQLGANHTVPKVKEMLDKYLNKKAHDRIGGQQDE